MKSSLQPPHVWGLLCVFLFAPLSLITTHKPSKELFLPAVIRKGRKKSVERHEKLFSSALHAQIDAPRLTGMNVWCRKSTAGKLREKKL
jgi:hypothetical protein